MTGSAKATVFIDNERVIVTEYRFQPGDNTGWHRHGHDYVVVPLMGGACGGCHTSVPLNRRGQIRAGLVLEGCEACGAILYPVEPNGSA